MNFKTVNQTVLAWETKSVRSKAFAEVLGKKYGYQDLAASVRKMVTIFQENELAPGSRIVLSVSDPVDTATLFWSLLTSGITVVGIDPEAGKERAQFIIQQADVQGVIVDQALIKAWGLAEQDGYLLPVKTDHRKKGKLYKKLLSRKKEAPVPATTFPAILDATHPATDLPEFPIDTLAYILFTSGTTANPKGVMISHKNLFSHLETLHHHYGLSPDSRILNILKLYHADGVIQGPVLAGYCQGVWHRPLEFEIPQIPALLDSVYKFRITHAVMVPTMLYLLDKFAEGYEDSFETPDFRCVVSVSSHIELALWERFEQKFKTRIVNVYGLTETVAGSFFCGPDDASRKIGTIGKPIDCEARIVKEGGEMAATGEEGELQMRGEHVFAGYVNNEPATAEALQDDWLLTGDLAVCDEEGFYKITGRKKNIIISGGVNIHPEEVTEVINTHPAVHESASLGIKDATFGEKLISCVVAESGQLDAPKLITYLRQRLESSKVPAEIHFMEELPKGLSGKVQMKLLLERLNAQINHTDTSSTLKDQVLHAAAKAFALPVEKLGLHDNSASVEGWDSMAHLDFITRLEDQFKLRFTTAEIMVMNSIHQAIEIIKRYQSTS